MHFSVALVLSVAMASLVGLSTSSASASESSNTRAFAGAPSLNGTVHRAWRSAPSPAPVALAQSPTTVS